MEKKFFFYSNNLQEVHSESEVIMSDYLEKLNRVSNDITTLEDKLKKVGIPFKAVYVFWTQNISYCADLSSDGEFEILKDICSSTDHCLVWGKIKNGVNRLSYQVFETENEIDPNDYSLIEEGTPLLKFDRPLIETKASVRLNVEKELPHFFKMIANSLKNEPTESLAVFHSPNYGDHYSEIARCLDESKFSCMRCNGDLKGFCIYC